MPILGSELADEVESYIYNEGIKDKLKAKDEHGDTALSRASRFNYSEIVKYLREHGATFRVSF